MNQETEKPITDVSKGIEEDITPLNSNNVADYFTNTINIFSDAFTAHMDVIGVHMDMFSDTINTHIETLKAGAINSRREANRPLREMIPRMPWHDVHASVSGVAARDLASHFVQVCRRAISLIRVTVVSTTEMESPPHVKKRTDKAYSSRNN